MAITLPQGLKITNTEAVDSRILMSKAEMLAVKRAAMPANYICVCKDDGKLYIWNKTFSKDEEIGYFRSYEDVMDIAKALNTALADPTTKAALESAVAGALPGAIDVAMQDSTKAASIANSMFDSEHFAVNLDNKIDLSISLIQAIDSN